MSALSRVCDVFVLQVMESGAGEGWGTTDFVAVEGTKEEVANRTQVILINR
jgi:hypothetical protein